MVLQIIIIFQIVIELHRIGFTLIVIQINLLSFLPIFIKDDFRPSFYNADKYTL